MTQSLEDVLRAALALPPDERATLADELLSSIEEESVEVDEETKRMLLERLASARRGELIDADEVLRSRAR